MPVEFAQGVVEIFGQLLLNVGLFVDGFESGDTEAWSAAVP